MEKYVGQSQIALQLHRSIANWAWSKMCTVEIKQRSLHRLYEIRLLADLKQAMV